MLVRPLESADSASAQRCAQGSVGNGALHPGLAARAPMMMMVSGGGDPAAPPPAPAGDDRAMLAKMHRDSRRAKRSLRRSKSSSVATSARRWTDHDALSHAAAAAIRGSIYAGQWEAPMELGDQQHAPAFDACE